MNTNLAGLNICLDQMKVVPGRPDLNAKYIISQIHAARKREVDLIIFPEMAVPGYFIGDKLQNDSFLNDISKWNREICLASHGLTVIFGTAVTFGKDVKGEDGYQRVSNAAMIAIDGKYAKFTVKTLQPNYRYFNDDKHMYSIRKMAAEARKPVSDLLEPITIPTKGGGFSLGVIICEDMWHHDYPENPTKVLVEKGAGLVINLSCSPWGWQKNRKRHEIVKQLLTECPVPFVYVNNTGGQNTGKNILVFDGSSTVYSPEGKIAYEVPAYAEGSYDFVIPKAWTPVDIVSGDDTAELYAALKCGLQTQMELLPPDMRKVIIGLSGGIDSAVSAALFVDVLGKDNVFTVNMPSKYNTDMTKSLAQTIADNLGVRYEIVPIDKLVDSLMASVPAVKVGSVAYENVQARMRMEILAAKAQAEIGGVFTCNSNKAEFAFGYGTMYADIAGFLAVLGDLVKREVRQIADYQNRVVFGREVIPEECINQRPSAELGKDQFDPFDYGDTTRRGYHDELIRAFTEFSQDPEWVLGCYLDGNLERELQLDSGTLKRLFPTGEDFLKDLEKLWGLFARSYVKRIQSPPIVVTSKRAFGRDLEEAMMYAHFTERYLQLKETLLERSFRGTVAIFGGSFNPPGIHHAKIVEALSKQFDRVVIVPCGFRPDKDSSGAVQPSDRKEMIRIAFADIPKVEFDWFDLELNEYTPTYVLDRRYKNNFPESKIYHVVGGDILEGGAEGQSQIHSLWKRGQFVWDNLQFAVINHDSLPVDPSDLPRHATMIDVPAFGGRSTDIRNMLKTGESPNGLLNGRVLEYIESRGLYRS